MAAEEVGIRIALPVVVGLAVGILEAFFVYEDENMTSGRDFLGDMWHGLLFALVGVIVASNVPWLLAHNAFPETVANLLFVDSDGNSIVISVIITLFMMVKMVGSHAIRGVRGGGFREKFWHKALVALLVGFAPYYIIWMAPVLEPVTSMLPAWMH